MANLSNVLIFSFWRGSTDSHENTLIHSRTKETKTREFFEKAFPELKKHREDKERFQRNTATTSTQNNNVAAAQQPGFNSRGGAYARSDAEVMVIADGLAAQEVSHKQWKRQQLFHD